MIKYFTIQELTHSATAAAKGIDNTPPPNVKVKITTLINKVLDPVRRRWGKPIAVNSGFRCPVLNKAVGGAAGSQHMKGEAADITTGTKEGNRQLFELIVRMKAEGFVFDQLIDEKGYRWIHISYSDNNRCRILHL